MIKRVRTIALVATLALPFTPFTPLAAPAHASPASSLAEYSWVVTNLGLSTATDINDQGQVAGTVSVGGARHAAFWSDGAITDFGTLGGGANSAAAGINNLGEVVGNSESVVNGVPQDLAAVSWNHGVTTRLSPPGNGALATAVNDAGAIVGFSIAMDKASTWNPGILLPTVIRTPISAAMDINNRGEIAGYVLGLGGVIWAKSSLTVIYDFQQALAINDRRQVLGLTNGGRAALWDDGSLIDVGPFGGYATLFTPFSLNNQGRAVGAGLLNGNRPYLWDNGATVDLNSLITGTGWTLTSASAINEGNQIVGEAFDRQGRSSAVLLTPTPIPAVFTLLFSGVVALGLAGRLRIRR